MRIWLMYTAFATLKQFMLCPNPGNVFRTVAYQPEECLLKLQDTGTLPGVRVTAEREVNQVTDDQGNAVRLDYCAWQWMKEIIYSVKVGKRDALLGPILDATVEAAKINARCSHPSGDVQGGCVSNFRKPPFSRVQRTFKTIS